MHSFPGSSERSSITSLTKSMVLVPKPFRKESKNPKIRESEKSEKRTPSSGLLGLLATILPANKPGSCVCVGRPMNVNQVPAVFRCTTDFLETQMKQRYSFPELAISNFFFEQPRGLTERLFGNFVY